LTFSDRAARFLLLVCFLVVATVPRLKVASGIPIAAGFGSKCPKEGTATFKPTERIGPLVANPVFVLNFSPNVDRLVFVRRIDFGVYRKIYYDTRRWYFLAWQVFAGSQYRIIDVEKVSEFVVFTLGRGAEAKACRNPNILSVHVAVVLNTHVDHYCCSLVGMMEFQQIQRYAGSIYHRLQESLFLHFFPHIVSDDGILNGGDGINNQNEKAKSLKAKCYPIYAIALSVTGYFGMLAAWLGIGLCRKWWTGGLCFLGMIVGFCISVLGGLIAVDRIVGIF
jgi:hypothetical protein